MISRPGARVPILLPSILFILAWTLGSVPAGARTWQVRVDGSGDAPSVQAGIDSAAAGDTVLVHHGAYEERVEFRGRDIVLRSEAGPGSTVLDAAGRDGRAVIFRSGETRAAVLEGFTITGGRGGILIIDAEPTIVGNIITENGPDLVGGGIWCTASTAFPWSPLIRANVIARNTAENLAGGIGTGQRMRPEILDNLILGNDAGTGDGGGIYYRDSAGGAVIRGNRILENTAGGRGGGIFASLVGSPPSTPPLVVEISGNLIAANTAAGDDAGGIGGGGLALSETQAWVHHNTIVGNGSAGGAAGGLGIEGAGSPVVEANILARNAPGSGVSCAGDATPILRDNLAWQNPEGDGTGACETWWQGGGNVVTDPYFCALPGAEYAVAQNSPALTHPAGPLGALPTPGCAAVAVEPTTWGRLKALYASP